MSSALKKMTLITTVLIISFVACLFVGPEGFSTNIDSEILFSFRLPRTITALIAGGAISLAGLLMQNYFKNVLAGPYVLGVQSGAALAIACTHFLGWSFFIESFTGFFGALVTTLIVLGMSRYFRRSTDVLIIGILISYLAGSLISFMASTEDSSKLKTFYLWSLGSFDHVYKKELVIFSVVILFGLFLAFLLSKKLDLYSLGKDEYENLGGDKTKIELLIILLTALLAGVTVNFCGPIVFIGIIAPFITRFFLKTYKHQYLIPGSFIIGAAISIYAGVPAVLDNYLVPINTTFGFLGVPILIFILVSNKRSLF